MGFQIEDGGGSGRSAHVDSSGHLQVHSITRKESEHVSQVDGEAYSWVSVSEDLAGGGTALLVANDSTTKLLYITRIYVWADVATQFKIHLPTYAIPAGGTSVVGKNWNTTSGNLAEATAMANETANTFAAANVITTVRNNEVGTDQFGEWIELDGAVILGYHKVLAVDVIADSAAYECAIFGYYLPVEA